MQSNNSDDLLQFKDFSNAPITTSPPAQINVNSPTNSSGSSGSKRNRGDPLADLIYDMSRSAEAFSNNTSAGGNSGGSGGGGAPSGTGFNAGSMDGESTAKVSFLTLEYYQKFFNVDTYNVMDRIVNSMVPKRAKDDYLQDVIGTNPDLYGPFWITVTLIFSIAISGNIASYLQHANDNYQWHYNFHLVSYAATCIFLYANILPAALWATFKYSLKPVQQEELATQSYLYTPSLLSLMCIYGYSLAIYIPVSILWVIQVSILQWILVISAALLSGSVLIIILSPALRNSKISLFLIAGILGAHFLLAAGFMLYFFHVPSNASIPPPMIESSVKAVTKAIENIVKSSVNATVATNASSVTG